MKARTDATGSRTVRSGAFGTLFVALLVVGAVMTATPAIAQEDGVGAEVTSERIAGDDRFATAAEVARSTLDEADAAILAAGRDFPDALVASYGPSGVDAPVLLSEQDELPDVTVEVLDELDVQTVFMMGGAAALSETVLDDLQARGYDTVRVAGDTRYDTAAAMLEGVDPPEIGTLGDDHTALLASGEDFADALAAGPVAASAGLPLLLTTPERSEATVVAADAMHGTRHDVGIERVVIVGGPQAVGEDVETYLRDERGFEVERWYGEDRSETAVEVASNAVDRLEFDLDPALLARGDAFPDALAASFHAAETNAPLLLARTPSALQASTRDWLGEHSESLTTVRAFGGPAAISETALNRAVHAATPPRGQPVTSSPHEGVTAQVGDSQTFELADQDDEGWPSTPNEMALFPCEVADFVNGSVAFADRGDGYAQGAGQTDSNSAFVSGINGVEQGTSDQRRDRAIEPGQTWTLTSDEVDCTVLVAWVADDGDRELPLQADGEPAVPFGVALMQWVD